MTQPRIQPNAPIEAVPEPQVAAALEAIEKAIDKVASILAHPAIEDLLACNSELESLVERLKELRSLAASPGRLHIQKQLRTLHKRALVVQAMIRQGAAFYRAAEQSQAEGLLGYTRRGLEHAGYESKW